MNSKELAAHFAEVKRGNTADHLTAVHHVQNVPKSKVAQDKLHRTLDHAPDAATEKDASVVNGVTRKPDEPKAANQPKPKAPPRRKVETIEPLPDEQANVEAMVKEQAAKRTDELAAKRARRTPGTGAAGRGAPIASKQPRKPATGSKSAAKPVPEPKPETKAASNGLTTREHNQELARRMVNALTKEFADAPPADWQKVANWLQHLPTGGEGAGHLRWWPEGYAKPTAASWRP